MAEPISATRGVIEPIPVSEVEEKVSQLGKMFEISTTKIFWSVFDLEQQLVLGLGPYSLVQQLHALSDSESDNTLPCTDGPQPFDAVVPTFFHHQLNLINCNDPADSLELPVSMRIENEVNDFRQVFLTPLLCSRWTVDYPRILGNELGIELHRCSANCSEGGKVIVVFRVKEYRVDLHALQFLKNVLTEVGLAGTGHSNDSGVTLRDVFQKCLRQLLSIAHVIHAHTAMRAIPPIAVLR